MLLQGLALGHERSLVGWGQHHSDPVVLTPGARWRWERNAEVLWCHCVTDMLWRVPGFRTALASHLVLPMLKVRWC